MEEQNTIPEAEAPQLPELKNTFRYFPFQKQWQPIVILILVGIVFYLNSIKNENALNDGILIHQNEYVLKGTKGINKIMTSDAYQSFYKHMNAHDQMEGGRYRPLPIVTYALEQEFIGTYPKGLYTYKNSDNEFNCWDSNKNDKNDPEEDLNQDGVYNEVDCQVMGSSFRHFNNVWMYILACLFLYLVFRNYMFRENQDIAFLSALIFVAHPIHSSGVANIAGRDEIMSLIFISLSFLFSFKFIHTKKLSALFWATLMFVLALFCKEYALVLLVLLPIALFVFSKVDLNLKAIALPAFLFLLLAAAMIILNEKNIIWFWLIPFVYILTAPFLFKKTLSEKNISTLLTWFFGAFLLYLGMRLNATILFPAVPDTEILNNPYVLATGEERFCSKVFIWLKYFNLLWFPHPLSSDYSYNSIEYRHFFSWDFILSALVNVTLLITGIKLVMKRHVLGFAIASYFLFLILVSNIFFSIGAIMIEHYLFHASIGFAIALAWFILGGLNKLSSLTFDLRRTLLFSSMSLLLFLYGCKVWERNADWKNDLTLFVKEVQTTPNSVLVLGNAGARWIDMCDTKYFNEPVQTNTAIPFSTYTVNMLQFKVSAAEFEDGIKAKDDIIEYTNGINNDQKLKPRELCLYKGIGYLKHAVSLHPRYVNGFLNLGLAYFKLNREREMLYYWKIAEGLYPNNPYLKNYYIVTYNMFLKRAFEKMEDGHPELAVEDYNKCIILDRYNPEGWYNLGGAYFKMGKKEKANVCWKETLKLNPSHPGAIQALGGVVVPLSDPSEKKSDSKNPC